MAYAIITGAHFFPYSWFFKTPFYAVFAGIISVGSLLLALNIPTENTYLIPLFTSVCLFILTLLLYFDYKRKIKQILVRRMHRSANACIGWFINVHGVYGKYFFTSRPNSSYTKGVTMSVLPAADKEPFLTTAC